MNSVSYPCTETSCSETCPDDHLILVSAGHHAMSPVVVLLLFISGLIHFASSLFFSCNKMFSHAKAQVRRATLSLLCRTCPVSPCKPGDTASELCREEFCSAILPPWYLAPDVQAACFWSHSWCLSGRQVGGALLLLCSLCYLFYLLPVLFLGRDQSTNPLNTLDLLLYIAAAGQCY